MARINNLTNFLNDVAAAIKEKLGDSTNIPAAQFDTKIREIETGGDYQSKTINISANGSQTITPDSEYDALSSVVINVQVPIPQLQNKSYEFTQNTHIVLSPETGYDGFSSIELTINVPQQGGSGDVKLFETIADMQADADPQEGDLAVVYREETQPVQEDSEFSSCIFPNTVVLDEAFTGSISGAFGGTEQGVTFAAVVEMSSSRFIFSDYVESEIIAQYTSSDGITYTRTDGGEELVEFGTTIKWESFFGPFNSIIGNFMKIGGMVFEGLYEYKTNQYVIADSQLTLSSSNQLLADIIGYGKNGIVTGDGTVLDNFTLYEFINSNIGEPYDIKTLHNSKIIYKNGSNNYNKTLLKHKTFDGTGVCMFEKLNPLENAIGSPSAFVKYQYGYVLIKIDSTNSIFTFVYYDSNFNYRHTQTVNVSKKMYVDGRAVNWYEDNTGLYCLLSPISNTTDIGMLHILDTTATIKLSTKTGTYRFNWGMVTSDHYGISVSGTYSSSKYTLYINKYNYSANTVTNITTLSNISLSNTRTSFAEDADNVYVCIGNSSYTASSTYQNCKVYVISKSTYTVSKTIDTGSKYAVFTSASDTAPCLVIIDSNGNATVNLMVNGNLEYQHDIARPTIEFYYWSKYMSNKQSLYITGGGYSFGYVSICTPTENNIVLPNIEWWSDTGNTYSSSLFSSAQPYDITENTIDVYTFTSTADFYHIHVDLELDITNTNEGEFILPISDKTKSYMAYAYFGYIFDNNYDTNLVLDSLDAGGAEQYLGGTPITDITNVCGFDVFNANGDSILYYVMKTVTARSNMTGFSMNNIRVLDNGIIQWIPYGNNTVFSTDDFLECTITCTDAYNNAETKIITIYNSEKENYPGPDDPGPDDPGPDDPALDDTGIVSKDDDFD